MPDIPPTMATSTVCKSLLASMVIRSMYFVGVVSVGFVLGEETERLYCASF